MVSSKTIDLTTGNILKRTVSFSLPICVGNVLQQLYGTVDTLVIGNFCNKEALAAVGTSAQPVEMLFCIFLGVGTGVSILVSQNIGRRDHNTVQETVATATLFLYIASLLVTVVGLLFSPQILQLLQVPTEIYPYACSYLNIIFIGTIGNLGYNLNAGILRGVGNSAASLLFLAVSCLTNIVLDIFFVAALQMNVAGAGWATSISMILSWICSILYIKQKYPELGLRMIPVQINARMFRRILAIGLPLGLNNSIYSVGHLLMQFMINLQGADFIAGCSIASRVTGISSIITASVSSAATTFAGQNFGARQYSRLKTGALYMPLLSGILTVLVSALTLISHIQILYAFNQDPGVFQMARRYLFIVAPTSCIYGIFSAVISYVNGIGIVRYPTIVNILTLWIVRLPLAYLITQCFDGTYLMISMPVSYLFGLVCMLAFFLTPTWKNICKKVKTD